MSLTRTIRSCLFAAGMMALAACSSSEARSVTPSRTAQKQFQEHLPPVTIIPKMPNNDLKEKIEGLDISDIYVVSQSQDQKRADQKPKYARRDETVWLYAVVKAKQDGKTVYFTEAESVRIGRKRIPKSKLRRWDFSKDLPLRWHKVEANSNEKYYDMQNDYGCPDALGDCKRIDYSNTPWKHGWKVKADVHPTLLKDQFPTIEPGLGVMRYKATVKYGEEEVSTPGAESVKNWRDTKKIPRVSYRNNQGNWTDYLFEMFNTPFIWGSTTSVVDNQVGSDCADLVVYGWRRAGHRQPYTWSYGLREVTRKIASPQGSEGGHFLDRKGNKIEVGKRVKTGDILLFPRHATVFYRDNGDGFLGRDDDMIHTLFDEPAITKIGYAPERVARWKK